MMIMVMEMVVVRVVMVLLCVTKVLKKRIYFDELFSFIYFL